HRLPPRPRPPLFPYTTLFRSNAAFADCLRICQEALQGKGIRNVRGGWLSRFLSNRMPLGGPDDLAKILDQFFGDTFVKALEACRDRKSTRLNSSHQIISYAVF